MRPPLVALAVLACAACHTSDWRRGAIENAERTVRIEAGDPQATFSDVQVTGDQSTGQVCGYVTAHNDTMLSGGPARFIFYIDGAGGNNPWVEGNPGRHKAPNFDFNWSADCVHEGYSR
jgi:hypothetical protein